MNNRNKALKFILLVLLGFLSIAAAGQAFAQGGTWETKASMPTARGYHGVGVVNGILYVVGGQRGDPCCDPPFSMTAVAYNPVTNTWTSVADMNLTRKNHAAGVIDDIVYAVGGDNDFEHRGPIDSYNPATNTWTLKASIPTPRNFLAAAVSNSILYAIGGNLPSSTVVEAYDPASNTWTTKASLLTPRHASAAGVVDGILYAVGGYNPQTGEVLASVESYEPTTNVWTSKAPMPTPRVGASVVVSDGILYAIGGHSTVGTAVAGTELATVEAYDPVTDTWTTMTPMPTARGFFGSGVIDGKLYAVGGVDAGGGFFATLEVFTPTVPVTAFAGFDAEVEIELDDGEFEVEATFTLGAASDGIDPVNEDVTLEVGTFSTTVPAGSFRSDRKGRRFTFKGVIDGVEIDAEIRSRGGNKLQFKAEAEGANLPGIVNPVTVSLTIGDDSGSATVTAEFD